jgi:predicted nucleic acid-binding protein
VICLDTDAAIAAFQRDPPENIAVHRARVHRFLLDHTDLLPMFPAVALSEYLWKAEQAELEDEIRRVAGKRMFTPAFDEVTAEVASRIGRSYVAGRRLGDVARETNTDRVCLRYDLLIVATAVQHSALYFLTGDPGCHALAQFAGLDSRLIRDLPDPPPQRPYTPPPPSQGGPPQRLFEEPPEGE